VTFFFFKSILCSCSDECGMPSKSPLRTTFQEPSMESSVFEEDEEEERRKGNADDDDEADSSAPAAAEEELELEELEELLPAAASASLSSSSAAHPLDHTTISPVCESSKHAA